MTIFSKEDSALEIQNLKLAVGLRKKKRKKGHALSRYVWCCFQHPQDCGILVLFFQGKASFCTRERICMVLPIWRRIRPWRFRLLTLICELCRKQILEWAISLENWWT